MFIVIHLRRSIFQLYLSTREPSPYKSHYICLDNKVIGNRQTSVKFKFCETEAAKLTNITVHVFEKFPRILLS